MMASATILRGEAPKGSGSGSGYGDGGYGSGYGDGYGYGDGSGGSGSGYGYGYGYGSGDGSGYGDGDGGYGYGSGYGYGDGYGSETYWRACIPHFAKKWPEAQQRRLNDLEAAGATIAYWRSCADGRACNGGKNDPVAPGTIEKISGPLQLCGHGALHATLMPPQWRGERWWIVALIGEVIKEGDKLGALEREIIGEAL